jgi:hypothetical protein
MRWFGLALLGIAIAAGVSIAASSLASQQIGLASQPISAGDALAPREPSAAATRHRRHRHERSPAKTKHTAPAPETTEAQPPAMPSPTVPATPTAPSSPGPSGGEQDHGGEQADD